LFYTCGNGGHAPSATKEAKDNNLIDKEKLAAMLRDQVQQRRAQAGQLYNAHSLFSTFTSLVY
jgi:hypothetical protein